jgi:hypothetical protein
MAEQTNYRVFCNEEQAYFTTWSTRTPVCCPNDYRHTIDTSQTVKLANKIEDVITVKIQEETVPTNGNYRHESFKFHVGSNGESYHDISFKYPISALGVSALTTETQRGDLINAFVIPKSATVGVVTQPINVGDSNFIVSNSVLNYLNPGYICILTNGSNISENLGEVVKANFDTNMITTQYATSNSYSASNLPLVQANVHYIKNLYITEPREYSVGNRKIGASFLQAGSIIRMAYSNASPNTEKEVVIHLEYLY